MAEVLTELCKMILPFQTIQKELKRKQNSLVAHSRKISMISLIALKMNG